MSPLGKKLMPNGFKKRPQAFGVWQWWNYCCGQIPEGKTVLKINMDETSICLFQGDQKGNVFLSKKRKAGAQPSQRVPRSKRRCCLTHVAFMCDRADLQHLLPQVIIGNESTFPARAMARLRSLCHPNVFLVRQKSAWNDSSLCALIVRWLALALRPHLAHLQPVLLFDAAKIHIAPNVLVACNAVGIWPLLVPAKTTWLLQPLDTHAFLAFKACLRSLYQQARIRAATGDLNLDQFLSCLCDAIRLVLQGRCWSGAFEDNGFEREQARVSGRVKRQLEQESADPFQVAKSRPTEGQLQCCFPKRTRIPTATLWKLFDRPAVGSASSSSASARPSALGLAVGAVDARLGRTRSEHRRAQAVIAQASGPVLARGSRLPAALARRR